MRKKRTEIDKLAAAFLAGEGKRQSAIAAILGLSQAVVSRMLKEAKDTYYREQIQFIRESVNHDEHMQILERIGRNDLAERLSGLSQRHANRRGPLVRVFSGDKGANEREKTAHFARQAAPYVKGLFDRASSCGVTWGGMLFNMVAALRALAVPPPWADRVLEIVPLSGEPLGDDPTSFSSSILSHDLGKLANGENYNARSLGMVPAFIPERDQRGSRFKAPEEEVIWRFIGLVRSYDEIFGTPGKEISERRPVAESLDMILTSVGPADRPLGFINGRLLETGKVTTEELMELIFGDIGGVCIPRPGLSARQRARLESVTNRWTGLKCDHLEACATRAAEGDPLSGKPGVVVISRGADRAQCVYEAVKRGLINQLVIDEELAQDLDQISKRDAA